MLGFRERFKNKMLAAVTNARFRIFGYQAAYVHIEEVETTAFFRTKIRIRFHFQIQIRDIDLDLDHQGPISWFTFSSAYSVDQNMAMFRDAVCKQFPSKSP